jgi:hypothetical protein
MAPKKTTSSDATVRLLTFSSLIRAQVAASVLRSHSIECSVEHEIMHSVLPNSALTPAGVAIRVAISDAHRAYDLLEEVFPSEDRAAEL